MKKSSKGLLLVLATAVISGFSIFLNNFGVKGIEPSLFAGLKNLSVGFIIVAVLLVMKDWNKIRLLNIRSRLLLVTVGLVGGSVPFLLFFNGLALTTGVKAGFIHKTMFLYVAILAMIFLKEKITKKVWIGIAALLTGQILFLNIKPQALNLGDLLILFATLLWTVEIILSKRLLGYLPARFVAASRMLFGGLFIWAFLLVTGQWQQVMTLTGAQIGWVAVTTIFLSAYVLTFYHGLKYLPAHVATSVLAIGAPITVILTAIFLDGTMVWQQVVGALVILVSLVALAFLLQRPKVEQQHVFTGDHK